MFGCHAVVVAQSVGACILIRVFGWLYKGLSDIVGSWLRHSGGFGCLGGGGGGVVA
jgi:hypothetical protein